MSKKGQTKTQSFIEASCNILTGLITAWLFTQYVAVPLLGIIISPGQNTILTACLTVVSVARSYFWRRIFNKYHIKKRRKDYGKTHRRQAKAKTDT